MFHQVPRVVQEALTPLVKRTLPTWERLEPGSSYDLTSCALTVDPYILYQQLRRKFALTGRALPAAPQRLRRRQAPRQPQAEGVSRRRPDGPFRKWHILRKGKMKHIIAFAALFMTSCAPIQTHNVAQAIPTTHESRSFVNVANQGTVKVSDGDWEDKDNTLQLTATLIPGGLRTTLPRNGLK